MHDASQELLALFGRLLHKQKQTLFVLERIERKITIMSATLDQVLQDTTDESTLEDSIITLLGGIKSQLDAITAGALPAATQAKVDKIFANLESNKAKVAAAITANTPPTVPVAPAGLAADSTTTPGSVALTFGAVPGATSYNIKRGTSAGAETTIGTSPTNSFMDTVSPGQGALFYVVTAVNAAGESPASNEVSVTV